MKRMKQNLFYSWLLSLLCLPVCANADTVERKQLFDDDWSFKLGDTPAASSSACDDTSWRKVDLPHDWSIEADFDVKAPAGNDGGYLPAGIGWYRKAFHVDKGMEGKKLRLYFEGVYMNSEVFINEERAGGHPYGYSSFFCDITPYLHFGQENVVAVRVDNSGQKNCRWYTGSGIYRHVWLLTTGAMHIDDWSVYIRPVKQNDSDVWNLDIAMRYVDAVQTGAKPEIKHTVYDESGREVATSASGHLEQSLSVNHPKLWSPDTPCLYTVCTQLIVGGKVIDEVKNTTGFRSIVFDSENGLSVNGKPTLLNGGCVHHDNGVLGARSLDAAEARKVRLLKEAGFNAVRTSHNVPSEAFLHECDRQGLLVIDEAFDGWRDAKHKHDYSVLFDKWWKRDIEAMVLRDRNHPSIFCWSIGNEVIERKKLEVVTTAKKLAEHVHALDSSRPVTSALTTWDKSWEIFDPLAAVHDIVGYNYQLHRAESDHERVPSRIIMQTESYPRDAFRNWDLVNKHAYIIGDFVWTALDYLGESGIGRFYYKGDSEGEHYDRNQYPWHGAYCGDIDLTGWRKPISHYREMLYDSKKKLYMAVREPNGYHGEIKETMWSVWPTWESWNWKGNEGKPIEVEVYSHYPKVRLFLNDTLVGERPAGYEQQFKAVYTLPYQAGTLRAVGVDGNGIEQESVVLRTSGTPSSIRLTTQEQSIKADGQDLAFVVVEVLDKNGNIVSDATNEIEFSVHGAGTLEATGSADLKDEKSYMASVRKAWKGRAIAVIRSTKQKGKVTLKVVSKGLSSDAIIIKTKK